MYSLWRLERTFGRNASVFAAVIDIVLPIALAWLAVFIALVYFLGKSLVTNGPNFHRKFHIALKMVGPFFPYFISDAPLTILQTWSHLSQPILGIIIPGKRPSFCTRNPFFNFFSIFIAFLGEEIVLPSTCLFGAI